jgi:hypothetical protein
VAAVVWVSVGVPLDLVLNAFSGKACPIFFARMRSVFTVSRFCCTPSNHEQRDVQMHFYLFHRFSSRTPQEFAAHESASKSFAFPASKVQALLLAQPSRLQGRKRFCLRSLSGSCGRKRFCLRSLSCSIVRASASACAASLAESRAQALLLAQPLLQHRAGKRFCLRSLSCRIKGASASACAASFAAWQAFLLAQPLLHAA